MSELTKNVEDFDTTLRDGLQVEGVSATVDDKLRIAEQLDGTATGEDSFPRSVTMRLVMRRPALALRLAVGIVRVLRR